MQTKAFVLSSLVFSRKEETQMDWATKEYKLNQRTVHIGKGEYVIKTNSIGGESTTKVYAKQGHTLHEVKNPQWRTNVLSAA